MNKLERLFGKQISNVLDINGQNKSKLAGRIHSQSTRSSVDDPTKILLKRFNRSSLIQNAVVKQQKIEQASTAFIQNKQSKDQKSVQAVGEYFQECFAHMLKQEEKNYKLTNYIDEQQQINEKMRGILIDWLFELHLKFKMFPQTIYATIMIIDSYLSKKSATKENLQLIGVAAFFIAAKYQETYQVPQLEDLVHYSAKTFSKQQIIKMEASIIEVLQFNLICETSFRFFQPLFQLCKLEPKNAHLAQYILQLSVLETKFLSYKPSLIASSSIYLVNKIRKRSQSWPANLQKITGYSEKDLKLCAKQLCHLFERADDLPNTKSLKKKFSLPQYNEVTRIKLQRKKQ